MVCLGNRAKDWFKILRDDLVKIFSGFPDVGENEVNEFAEGLKPVVQNAKLANFIHAKAQGEVLGPVDQFIIEIVIKISDIISGSDYLISDAPKPLSDATSAKLVPIITNLMMTNLVNKLDGSRGGLLKVVIGHLRHWINVFTILKPSGVEQMPKTRLAILEATLNLHCIRVRLFAEKAQAEDADLLGFLLFHLDYLEHYFGIERFENNETVAGVFLIIERLGRQMGPDAFKLAIEASGRKFIHIQILQIYYGLFRSAKQH